VPQRLSAVYAYQLEKLAGLATASPPEKQLKYLSVFSPRTEVIACVPRTKTLVLTDPFHKRPSFDLHPFHKRPLKAKAIPPVPFAYLKEGEVDAERNHATRA
jgi:hypothetical protein